MDLSLSNAVQRADIKEVEYLLIKGDDFYVEIDRDGYTPLLWSSYHDEIEIFKILIINKVNYKHKSNKGN